MIFSASFIVVECSLVSKNMHIAQHDTVFVENKFSSAADS